MFFGIFGDEIRSSVYIIEGHASKLAVVSCEQLTHALEMCVLSLGGGSATARTGCVSDH